MLSRVLLLFPQTAHISVLFLTGSETQIYAGNSFLKRSHYLILTEQCAASAAALFYNGSICLQRSTENRITWQKVKPVAVS